MIRISCEGETSLEVLSHLKGFASLISRDVPANTGTMPEDIVAKVAPHSQPVHTEAPVAVPATAPMSTPTPANPTYAPAATPVPAPAPIPAPTHTPPAPVSASYAAPTPQQPPVTRPASFTYEQIGKAGADLVAASPQMMPTLMALLQRYGVQLVTDLKPEHLGPFAGELRALGAKI